MDSLVFGRVNGYEIVPRLLEMGFQEIADGELVKDGEDEGTYRTGFFTAGPDALESSFLEWTEHDGFPDLMETLFALAKKDALQDAFAVEVKADGGVQGYVFDGNNWYGFNGDWGLIPFQQRKGGKRWTGRKL